VQRRAYYIKMRGFPKRKMPAKAFMVIPSFLLGRRSRNWCCKHPQNPWIFLWIIWGIVSRHGLVTGF